MGKRQLRCWWKVSAGKGGHEPSLLVSRRYSRRVLRVAGRLLMLGSVLVVGILLTAGVIYLALFVLSLFFPNGIGPDDDFALAFASNPPTY